LATLPYIKYFWYLASNWNIGIAWHLIKQEVAGEKKYGISTTGAIDLDNMEETEGIDTEHASQYMPVSYKLLQLIFTELPKIASAKPKHFLDIGCGKGRALCVAAHYGFIKLSGVDFSKRLINAAQQNLEIVKTAFPQINYTLQHNDAFYYDIPTDVDCIFLFNPFDEVIMSGVVNNIAESFQQQPRTMTIIYVNCLYKHLFTAAGFKEVFYKKEMTYLEVSILQHLPA
jgi:SAM-dependent methyltransferase